MILPTSPINYETFHVGSTNYWWGINRWIMVLLEMLSELTGTTSHKAIMLICFFIVAWFGFAICLPSRTDTVCIRRPAVPIALWSSLSNKSSWYTTVSVWSSHVPVPYYTTRAICTLQNANCPYRRCSSQFWAPPNKKINPPSCCSSHIIHHDTPSYSSEVLVRCSKF